MAKRAISDTILKDRGYEIARNRNYDGYQRALASMVYNSFEDKTGSRVSVNEQLAEKLHKQLIKKFKRKKFYARFKEITWAADLAKKESLSSNNKNVKYLLCLIDISCAGKTFPNAFIEMINESHCKPNKLWVDQGREFYNKLMKKSLDNNDILRYSTHNEGKSVIAERFIKILKAKIYKKNEIKSYLSYQLVIILFIN